MSSQHSNGALRLGDRIKWFSDTGMEYGTVHWIGILPDDTSTDLTVGVEFDKPIGIGTGKYKQHRLFTAKRGHASLIPLMGLVRADEEGTHPVRQQQYGHQASSDSPGQGGHSQSSDVTDLLRVGDRVMWPSDRGLERGTVRWIGILPDDDTDDIMAGIEFDNPVGTGTGKYKEHRLFHTKQDHASIIPLLGLVKADDEGGAQTTAGHSADTVPEGEPIGLGVTIRPQQPRQPQQPTQPMSHRASETTLECYKMDADTKGICVIINNRDFYRDPFKENSVLLKKRYGTDIDRDKLKATFTSLNFTVRCYDNQTDTQMLQTIQQTADENRGSSYNAFVCCILTHGTLGEVYGANGVSLAISKLTGRLCAQSCESLSGKPKLFILQACQGEDAMRGAHEWETDAVGERRLIPNDADFLLAYSTVPGYVSYRHAGSGTWFIGTLTDIMNQPQRQDIQEILTKVNNEVGSKGILDETGVVRKQAPAVFHTLRKKLYFRDN